MSAPEDIVVKVSSFNEDIPPVIKVNDQVFKIQ
jgi:hypothetical protein